MAVQFSTPVRTDQAGAMQRAINGGNLTGMVAWSASTVITVGTYFVTPAGLVYQVSSAGSSPFKSGTVAPTTQASGVTDGNLTVNYMPPTMVLSTGNAPSNCAASATGAVFATLTMPQTSFTASGGVATLTTSISGTASGQLLGGYGGTQTYAYFRVLDGASNVLMQGQLGAAATINLGSGGVWASGLTANVGDIVYGTVAGNGSGTAYQLTGVNTGTSYTTSSSTGPTSTAFGTVFNDGTGNTWYKIFSGGTSADWTLSQVAINRGVNITVSTAPTITMGGA